MRPIAPSLPADDDIGDRQLVMRDGTVASVRPVTEADFEEMRRFFREETAEVTLAFADRFQGQGLLHVVEPASAGVRQVAFPVSS